MKRIVVLLLGVALLAGLSFSVALGAPQKSESRAHLESTLVGIATPLQVVRGVTGGGLPWVGATGKVELQSNGKLEVSVRDLLISAGPLAGTTGPVTMVVASLTCEGTNVVATTSPAPLSASGDAEIEEKITMPASCIGPIVLIQNAGGTMPWLAATGF